MDQEWYERSAPRSLRACCRQCRHAAEFPARHHLGQWAAGLRRQLQRGRGYCTARSSRKRPVCTLYLRISRSRSERKFQALSRMARRDTERGHLRVRCASPRRCDIRTSPRPLRLHHHAIRWSTAPPPCSRSTRARSSSAWRPPWPASVGGMDIPLHPQFRAGREVRDMKGRVSRAEPDAPAASNNRGRGVWDSPSAFDRGADIIYHAQAAASAAACAARVADGKLGIGVDSNQDCVFPGAALDAEAVAWQSTSRCEAGYGWLADLGLRRSRRFLGRREVNKDLLTQAMRDEVDRPRRRSPFERARTTTALDAGEVAERHSTTPAEA